MPGGLEASNVPKIDGWDLTEPEEPEHMFVPSG